MNTGTMADRYPMRRTKKRAKSSTRKPSISSMVSSAVNRSMIKSATSKPRRRLRRKSLSDDMGKGAEQLIKAAAGGGAALVVFKKVKPTSNAKTNAIIHVGIGAAIGIMALKKGQPALGFGYAAGIAVLVLGQFVPQLAEGTMADSMAWANQTLGDQPQAIIDPYTNRNLIYGNGDSGLGMYYADNLTFADYDTQSYFGLVE